MAALDQDRTQRGKYATVPPVIELSSDDPSFRPVRLVLKKYDTGTSAGASAGDNLLSPAEFAIDARDFASADTDGDNSLDTEELRRFLGRVEPDLELMVKLSGERPDRGDNRAVGCGHEAVAARSSHPEAHRWRYRGQHRRGEPRVPRRRRRARGR